jgi:hypothetical protein
MVLHVSLNVSRVVALVALDGLQPRLIVPQHQVNPQTELRPVVLAAVLAHVSPCHHLQVTLQLEHLELSPAGKTLRREVHRPDVPRQRSLEGEVAAAAVADEELHVLLLQCALVVVEAAPLLEALVARVTAVPDAHLVATSRLVLLQIKRLYEVLATDAACELRRLHFNVIALHVVRRLARLNEV